VIRATGTVMPSRDVILRPRISGRVVGLSDDFTPGWFVGAGDPLVSLDPSDYENELAQRESELAQAQAELQLEMGRQEAARMEFELLGEALPVEERALVLRKPQLAAARARVASARAAVKLAELRLGRTKVRAPFDAHVLTRDVNVGSQVSSSEPLARLVGRDTYWIELTVPLSKVRWLAFPDAKAGVTGAPVRIRNQTAWPPGEHRKGRLFKLVGALAGQTRMARVLVEVDDPLARSSEAPALMIGEYVQAQIQGRPIVDCLRVERHHVRNDDTVWVMADGRLDICKVGTAFRDATHAYVREGLADDDWIVTTDLATVVDGARLRTSDAGTAGPGGQPTQGSSDGDGE